MSHVGTTSTLWARPLCRGTAAGSVVVLLEALSFWGGVDHDGRIVEAHHPDRGRDLAGSVLVMPGGRGSSSSSSVLAELIRTGRAPVAIVLGRPDAIIALGSIVADELYGVTVPVVVVDIDHLHAIAEWPGADVVADPVTGTARVSRRHPGSARGDPDPTALP